MKLCRYGRRGEEKPGLIDAEGHLRDLSTRIGDLTPAEVTPQALAKLRAIDPTSLPRVAGTLRYGVPVNGIGKFIAIGLNYSDHAKEAGLPLPAEPVFFTKAISCLNGPTTLS